MGASTFVVTAHGKTAGDAFKDAKEIAASDGDDDLEGYSGTIYEKRSFVIVSNKTMTVADAVRFADDRFEAEDQKCCDKHGPCGCIRTGDDTWLFFGLAPS